MKKHSQVFNIRRVNELDLIKFVLNVISFHSHLFFDMISPILWQTFSDVNTI